VRILAAAVRGGVGGFPGGSTAAVSASHGTGGRDLPLECDHALVSERGLTPDCVGATEVGGLAARGGAFQPQTLWGARGDASAAPRTPARPPLLPARQLPEAPGRHRSRSPHAQNRVVHAGAGARAVSASAAAVAACKVSASRRLIRPRLGLRPARLGERPAAKGTPARPRPSPLNCVAASRPSASASASAVRRLLPRGGVG
jgi:hypothetical protein